MTRPRSGTVKIDGGAVYAERSGAGVETIVVPSSLGISHDFLQALLDPLGLPLELIYFDPEGVGESSGLPAGWNPARVVDEAEAVRRWAGLTRTVLLGHGGGAFLALEYALEHPQRVVAMILVSPFACYRRVDEAAATALAGHPNWPGVRARAEEIRRVGLAPEQLFRATFKEQRAVDMFEYGPFYFDMAAAADEASFNPAMYEDEETDLLDELNTLTFPVLIVTGENDPLIPVAESRLMAAELEAVRLVELPQCGHYPFVEQPEMFATAVTRFLEQIGELEATGNARVSPLSPQDKT